MAYGLRVLSTVRDSMLPDMPEEQVEATAMSHFLHNIRESMLLSPVESS